jgi:signal transduction histidine kinase
VLVLIFSIFLITSVWREEEQRQELERLNGQLDDKNQQLDQLSHFKSELLSLASHQIRSPLAAIKGFVTLIIGGSYGEVSDKTKEALGKVQHSADELIGLINTLLDVRKVEEGKMEYVFARTDLNKMVGSVVDLLRPLAETKKLEFTYVSSGKEVFVNADAEKLKQVIQNLTDNSIKYTPAGFVHVELKEENGAAIVSVADSGLGVSATLIPFLFEEFVRDARVKKEIRGTGLGLYIARKISEAHGGKISATSGGEGKGSTFSVSIPLLK